MQKRRLESKEPEDEKFVFRWWADLQFFIVTLRRLRRLAELPKSVPSVSQQIAAAIAEFDRLKIFPSVARHEPFL
jgi:hypothetical protein